MTSLDTLTAFTSSRVAPDVQAKLTSADLAWALEIPALDSLLAWLARVVEADERAGGTTSLEEEEREIWDRARTLKVVQNIPPADGSRGTSSTPSGYRKPSELAEMTALNQSIAALKERRVRQLELNIDRLQRRLHDQTIANEARLQYEAALAQEITTLESDLTSFGLLFSSTLLPTLLDSLHTSLTPHLHPPSSPPVHLTQSPALLHSVATSSKALSQSIAYLVNSSRPDGRRDDQDELDAEARRLEDVFGDLREEAWEKEMERYLAGDDEEVDTELEDGVGTSIVTDLMAAGREEDRLQEVEREVEALRVAKTHLSDTLLPTALALQVALTNDVTKLRELEALVLALAVETAHLQAAGFKGTGDSPGPDLESRERRDEALRLILSSAQRPTDAPILTHSDFLGALSDLTSSNTASRAALSAHALSLARHSSSTQTASLLSPLLAPLLANSPTPLHPMLSRSNEVRAAEVEFDQVRMEVGLKGREVQALDRPAGKEEAKGAERVVRENADRTAVAGGKKEGR